MINEEPMLARDRAMMGLLLPLGIVKGKAFKPAATTQSALAQSARDAHAWLMNGLLTFNTAFWPDSSWSFPAAPAGAETVFSFERPNYLDVDARALTYFLAYAPPKKLGAATFYLEHDEVSLIQHSSLRGAKRRSNPERRRRTGLLRFARNDERVGRPKIIML